jgi:seryl-tRNA synthetase
MTHPDLVWYDNGQAGYGGTLLALSRALDRVFLSWAAEWQAAEYVFPPFLPARELAKIDYLGSFPHLATFPVTLDSDEENLERFVQTQRETRLPVPLLKTTPVRDVLTPAACYHVYIHLQGQTLAQPRFVTTRANCFRREERYEPLERQWGFSMREIVCVGASEVVKGFLEAMQGRLEAFFQEAKWPVRFLTATDPFFKPATSLKAFAQRLDPVKAEMVFEDRLAIGSVNFHRNYFGEAFGIRCGDKDAFSGCVAFGVERWMSAVCKHFGDDPDAWPAPLALDRERS